MANYNYYKSNNGVTEIPAKIETAYGSGDYVTFEQRLNSNYGDYADCVICVPTELKPEVCENVYGESVFCLNGLDEVLTLDPSIAYQPIIRLPITEIGGKSYAYIDLERRKMDKHGEYVKFGKTVRVLCEIREA